MDNLLQSVLYNLVQLRQSLRQGARKRMAMEDSKPGIGFSSLSAAECIDRIQKLSDEKLQALPLADREAIKRLLATAEVYPKPGHPYDVFERRLPRHRQPFVKPD